MIPFLNKGKPVIRHSAFLITILTTAILASAVPLPCKSEGIFPFPCQVKRLDNGLTAIVVPYDSPGIIAYYTAVRAGSRDEIVEGHTGFAHLFEHMMFRGTRLYPGQNYNRILKTLGTDKNAFTTDDWTCYTNSLNADHIEDIIKIEADRFINLQYSETTFRKESGAVLGEYNKNSSHPYQILFETLVKEAFTTHTYRHTTMGFLEDIEAMPDYYDYSLEFYRLHYRPENCAVIAVGDLDAEKVLKMIEESYSDWKPGHSETVIPAEPPQNGGKSAEIAWENSTLPYLLIAWHVPAFSTTDLTGPALEVLSELLFSETAPLYQELVIDDMLVEYITGEAEKHRDPYLFHILARVKNEEDVDAVKEKITSALENIAKNTIDEGRLERARSHLKNSFLMRLDKPGMIAVTLGNYFNLTGDPVSLNEYYDLFDKVTPETISKVVETYFTDENKTVVTLLQRGEE
jgi:zinc protease